MTNTFTEAEIDYLNDQTLGRIATVGPDGRPHVVPVAIFYDPENRAVVIGNHTDMAESKIFRDAQSRPEVALVVDDLAAVDPWTPRGVEIRGRAQTHTEGGGDVGERLGAGYPFGPAWLLIRPRRVVTWGLDDDSFAPSARDVV